MALIKQKGSAMTTPRATIKNRQNAKKSTGPITVLGKAKVRGNATTHGARAKHFINQDEQQAYQLFLEALQLQYPSQNPLVMMQLDRIANFKVQADRIQRSIDATFAASELKQSSNEILMDLLEMDKDQKKIAENIDAEDLNIKELINLDRIRVATELAAFDASSFKSQNDFIFHTPLFCQLLLNEANEYDQDIDYFIEQNADLLINLNGTSLAIMKSLIKLENKKARNHDMDSSDLSIAPTPEQSLNYKISQVKLKNLHFAAKLYGNEINRVGEIHYKVQAFNQLKKIERKPLALNYEQLDKLQRYQTTIQGQLSRMVGELLELVK